MASSNVDSDPLREVRAAKRWALAGVAAAVLSLVPLYGLTLGLTVGELAFVLVPAAVTGYVAIEFSSHWETRMRRRYAYPHQLGYELATIYEFPRACQLGAERLRQWLHADAVVIAWVDDDGSVAPVAASGYEPGWTERAKAISASRRGIAETLDQGRITVRAAAAEPWFQPSQRGDRVTYIPLVSRGKVEGVLAIAASRNNPYVNDRRLVEALGTMAGLALDNARLYEGQRAYAQRLQELNRMKSDFLSTVSHELRTPLTSIMVASEMLLEEEQDADPDSPRTRLVSNIVKGASRLSSLVKDLVNVSRDDDFQPRLELDSVALADPITSAVGIIHPLLAAKRQQVEVTLEDPHVLVKVDRLRLEQVLTNLLSNAQRYSPPGGRIVLRVRNERDETMISVTDSGPGVPEEDREMIFEPFFRGGRSGLGLGLAIAKSLVELHHGRIWVESDEGGGSSFFVALPAHNSPRTAALAARHVALSGPAT